MTTPVQEHLDRLTSAHAGEGEVPDGLGVAMLLVDGHRYVSGSMTSVPLATLASPLFHAQALEDLGAVRVLSLIHISEPTRREWLSRMPSSA